MTHDQAKSLADEALNKLAAALEQGHSETLRAYLAVMARFRRYSWANTLLPVPSSGELDLASTSTKPGRALLFRSTPSLFP